jgi:predicted RNA methylase
MKRSMNSNIIIKNKNVKNPKNIKIKKLKTILGLFPYLEDKSKASNLKIDDDSINFITVREHAKNITDIITYHLSTVGICKYNATITDTTAGVGGNSISFGMNFKKAYALEIDNLRSEYLTNNINIYDLSNVVVLNCDSTKIMCEIDDHDVIFMDPPWGGKSYKNYKFLRLKLSHRPIEDICNNMMNSLLMKKCPRMIVYKLPSNYDVKYFYDTVQSPYIFFHNLKKMLLMVVINPNSI